MFESLIPDLQNVIAVTFYFKQSKMVVERRKGPPGTQVISTPVTQVAEADVSAFISACAKASSLSFSCEVLLGGKELQHFYRRCDLKSS